LTLCKRRHEEFCWLYGLEGKNQVNSDRGWNRGSGKNLECWVRHFHREDVLVDACQGAGLDSPDTAFENSRGQASTNSDIVEEVLSGKKSFIRHSRQELRQCGSSSAPEIRLRLNPRDCTEGNIWFSSNSWSSIKSTSYYEKADSEKVKLPLFSVRHILTSAGYTHVNGASFPLHIGVQSRLYAVSSERIPSVPGKRECESGKTDGAPDFAGKQGTEKSWIQVLLPRNSWPYAQLARIEKPIGTWLLAWPCFW
jgi:hypothetical protein